LQVFRDLEGCDDKQTEQHRVDNSIVRGRKNHDVVDLPLAVNRPAHMGMDERYADQGDDKKQATKQQAKLGGCQAVQPDEEPSLHGSASTFWREATFWQNTIAVTPVPRTQRQSSKQDRSVDLRSYA
jgi:hypothetical protein